MEIGKLNKYNMAFGKELIIIGIVIVIIGIIMNFGGFNALPKLPGDIYIKKDNFTLYFPWVTSLVISGILSLIFYLFFRK